MSSSKPLLYSCAIIFQNYKNTFFHLFCKFHSHFGNLCKKKYIYMVEPATKFSKREGLTFFSGESVGGVAIFT